VFLSSLNRQLIKKIFLAPFEPTKTPKTTKRLRTFPNDGERWRHVLARPKTAKPLTFAGV
jgi:hypothetical protein